MKTRGWALIAATLLLAGCGKKENTEAETTVSKAAAAGRVVLPSGAAQRAGISFGVSGPAEIDVTLQLPGEIKPDSAHVLVVRPRFAGVVRALTKSVGAYVHRGETLASVQSNESLTEYAVTSSMPGRVVARGSSVGEVVSPDTPLYTVIDLSDVWLEFAVYPQQIGSVRQGQYVLVTSESASGPVGSGRIAYVGPALAEGSPVSMARVVLSNRNGAWQPGLFVNVTVVTEQVHARVAVPDSAIVRTDQGPVVFVTDGRTFLRRPVVVGRSDGRMTEILSGLGPRTRIAVANAFVVKAEMEKSEYEE